MSLWERIISFIMGVIMTIATNGAPVFEPKNDMPLPEVIGGEKFDLITSDGESDFVIVSAMEEGTSEYFAAKKLQSYLEQISGTRLPIVKDTEKTASDYEIVVGHTNRDVEIDDASLGNDGIMIKISPKQVVLAGGKVRGTLYSVYEFLEVCFGCRWYTEDLTVIPNLGKAELPVSFEYTYTPAFTFRETDWISPNRSSNREYSYANRFNAGVYRDLSVEEGDTVDYAGSFAHTLTNQFCVPSKYFDTQPELFAMNSKGQRIPDQLCLTNPKTLEIVTNEVLSMLEADPSVEIVSVTQHDNQKYCVCKNCKALDKKEGSHSGTMITFVNAIAEAVEEAGYKNVFIDTFAYQYTRKPPKNVTPRDNVIVRLCSIECCFAHALNDEKCGDNVEFCEDIVGWSKICKNLHIWDYTTNYAHYNGPFPNFGVMQENAKFFREHNVIGVYEEGNYNARECNGEFAELRAYLLSKLLWNPDTDYYREMNGFLKAYYGEDSWQYIREYIDMTTEHTGTRFSHMGIYQSMTDRSVLDITIAEREYIDTLWENAKANAKDDITLRRIRLSEISWRYWKACNNLDEFNVLRPQMRRAENEKLYNDFKELGITRLREGQNGHLSDSPDFNKVPSQWK